MSGILDPFLESIHNLPCNVMRNLILIGELDKKVLQIQRENDAMAKQYVYLSEEKKDEVLDKIHRNWARTMHLSEEKTNIAQQMYNMVDKQITQIDDEIEKVKEKQTNSDVAGGHGEKGGHGSGAGGSGGQGGSGSHKDGKKGRRKTKAFDSAADVIIEGMCLNMEIDPNEPKYCTCQQVSYGEMIGCDEKDCPFEWFHFPCVNLKSKPKGKWYCENCTKKRSSSK